MITVKVTKEDISRAKKIRSSYRGHKATCQVCPIALALKRTQKKKVSIYNSNDIFVNGNHYFCKENESLVDEFIDDFDSEKNVSPIKFVICPY